MSRAASLGLGLLILLLHTPPAQADDERVCVKVVFGVLTDAPEPAAGQPPAAEPATVDSESTESGNESAAELIEQQRGEPAADRFQTLSRLPPRAYLRRLVQHFVQHERGFSAVDTDCTQSITVELFPTTTAGWTVFARYTGYESEERVDRVQFAEFPKLARRLTKALLFDRRVEETLTRSSVLEADSPGELTTVDGTHLFQLGIGSTFRFPVMGLPTRVKDHPDAPVTDEFRPVSSVDLQIGYRGDFQRWAIDTNLRLGIGTSATDSRSNTLGGHVDHMVDLELGLNFLWNLSPDDVWSVYMGPGARFSMLAFDVVEPSGSYDGPDLLSAGLDIVGVLGFEFLRMASVRGFGQLEVSLPAYVFRTQVAAGGIDTWMPGLSFSVGALF